MGIPWNNIKEVYYENGVGTVSYTERVVSLFSAGEWHSLEKKKQY